MKLKMGAFFGVITFILLLSNDISIGMALFMLVPATILLSLVVFLVYEEVLTPLYKWLTK